MQDLAKALDRLDRMKNCDDPNEKVGTLVKLAHDELTTVGYTSTFWLIVDTLSIIKRR